MRSVCTDDRLFESSVRQAVFLETNGASQPPRSASAGTRYHTLPPAMCTCFRFSHPPHPWVGLFAPLYTQSLPFTAGLGTRTFRYLMCTLFSRVQVDFLHLNSPHLAHARTLSHFSHWVTQAITTVRSSWVGQFITTNNRILI